MIIDDLYKFNFNLLTKSNLPLNPRCAESKEFFKKDNDCNESIYEEAFISSHKGVSTKEIDILNKPLLGFSIVFGLFDIYLDTKYINIQGKSYKQKHDLLPTTNNIEIIQKSFFRIFRLIRNAITHNATSINYSNYLNTIRNDFNKTNFELDINDKNLNELYAATLLLMNDSFESNRGKYMKEGILKWYYDSIINNITIRDDDCTFTDLLSDVISLNPMRDLIVNAEFCINHNNLIIKNSKFTRPFIRDFVINFENDCYVIPEEHLINYSIPIENLVYWKSNKDNLLV